MDPYDVLGVPRDASDDEIKEAYREKAKEFHPDTSEREDAAEMFKKVKDAYEAAYSGDTEGVSPGYPDSGSSGKDPGSDGKRRRNEKGGFGTGGKRTSETNDFSGGATKAGTGTDAETGAEKDAGTGTRTGTETGPSWNRRGFYGAGKREKRRKYREQEKTRDTQQKNEDTESQDPEDFEVHEEYDMGWKLGQTETGGWFVFTEGETAPYADGTKLLYLDLDGSVSTEAVYFGSKEAAEENYEEHYGTDDDFGHEHEKEDSHRGFSHKGESYKHRTEQKRDDFEEEGWGERQESGDFDGLWRLYYQERKEEGRNERRWGVTTKVTGDDRFVNPEGEYQRAEFWFDERHAAVSAYEKYVRRMKEAREGFEEAKRKNEDDWTQAESEEEELIFTAADKSITFLETVDNRIEPLKENPVMTVIGICLFFAVAAYLFEPVREVLTFFALPVYVGFATVVQTPHLIFFVVAYAAIVTVLVVAQLTQKF